ncbi:MAG: hypothetical protein K9H11_03760 [Rhodospirillum sp.]|nr:hypothetical protein [Rhodospirillum sp.]
MTSPADPTTNPPPKRRGSPMEPLLFPHPGLRGWGYGILAAGFAAIGLVLPMVVGARALPWMPVLLAPAVWMGLMSWGHAVLLVTSNPVGMRVRAPLDVWGVLLPPPQDIRFPWEAVTEIHLLESQDPRALTSWGKKLSRPEGELRIMLADRRVVRLTWTMVEGHLLDIAELVAVASNQPVQGRDRYAPGGILGDME